MPEPDLSISPRAIWKLTWPQMLMMYLVFFMGFINIWVAGRISADVQAALGMVNQCGLFLMVVAMSMSSGATAAVSQSLGAKRLRRAGSDHRKYIRQVFVSVDITAPMYWWKEYDTYKVATVANSTSTMHKIHSKPFELDDFSHDHLTPESEAYMQTIVDQLEKIRLKYVETKDKAYWYDMIQLLPSSYNQMRTCTLNYETLINIYFSRKNHKLDEWHTFCDWIKTLPYAKELILAEEEEA